ncbi:MAG: hypothetical protein H6513_15880 [Acidimicrobiaceae bacterium]|nr:hypothetical protein [Ilumatobacter sp.]MCB9382164.1 hypothetical protein [Acidimicrobiaceae bacterium]MCO5330918.1 hypothetical protein [Ilumatobacteraceae bacterium]
MTRAAAVTAYRLISGAVLAGAITLCVAAWHLGTERTGRATAYFYEVFDIGHPGIVNAVTSMALVAVATISVMLGLSTGLTPWLVNAALFLVLAADNVLRLHNIVPAGDVIARLVYWAVLAWLLVRLRPLLVGARGGPLLILGLALLAAGELLDVIGNDGHHAAAVFEEALGCVGAWALAMACVGVAMSTLTAVTPEPPVPG